MSTIAKRFSVAKANPLWDGDGVQGAGQPRDRTGRWVKLPGKSALKKIGAWELEDGSFGVFKDDEEEPFKVYRRKGSANKAVADAIKLDAKLYAQKVLAPKHQKMRQEEEARSQRVVAEHAPRQSGIDLVPTKGRASKKPPRKTVKVTLSENDSLPVPGRPTQAQVNDANKWARQNMKSEEAKYAELITRLLKNKGITQNPRMRKQMSERYGVPANRLIEIESQVYDHMFPKSQSTRRVRIEGRAILSPGQSKTSRTMGARRIITIATPDNPNRPRSMFKANKGENRGNWVMMEWNGAPEVINESEAARHAVESKIFWTRWLAVNREAAARMAAKRRESQRGLVEADIEDKKARKEWKIKQAQKWAEDNGFDPDDSYWWGMFWNDPSLIKGTADQDEDIADWARPMRTNLAPVVERAHMDPKILEGLLALPDDFDTRKMRGQRPGSSKARKGDEDFEEATAESRQTSPEWESRNRDRAIRYDQRMRRRYEKYKAKHPKSKLSYAQFKDAIEQGAVVKSRHPRWDGDGLQAPGQPRDRRGRWSDSSSALGAFERTMNAFGGSVTRMSASGKGKFDHKNKSVNGTLSRLPRNSVDQILGPNGKPLARKKMKPESAIYLRNNGATKITDKRLTEIYDSMFRKGSDAKPATQQEQDLLLNAAGREEYDGTSAIRVWTVRDRVFKNQRRDFVMNTIRKELSNRAAKAAGGERGERGHVIRRTDIAPSKKQAENAKRVASGRNFVRASLRKQLMEDFGDGISAKCIFCGLPVLADVVSPERMKPGPLGGKYERGNLAPAHEKCNTRHGTAAQHNPQKYYDDMMKAFMTRYRAQINKGELGFVFAKNRGKLQGKRVVKK